MKSLSIFSGFLLLMTYPSDASEAHSEAQAELLHFATATHELHPHFATAGWTLDPISTDEHLRINFSLQPNEAPKIENKG